MSQPVRIAPSVLAADFGHLADEISRVAGHADWFHFDVMDGHFVPNVSLGIPVIAAVRPVTDRPFDCHLMMTNAHAYLEPLAQAGADIVTVHVEAYPEPAPVAAEARRLGLRFGLALNPLTPFAAVDPHLELCDLVLVMSVEPGFGGQSFRDDVLGKVAAARKSVDRRHLTADIEIDGGITPSTIARAREAGADVFVAGTSVFGAADPVAAIAELRSCAERG